MSFKEYSQYDGLGLAELAAKGEVTPIELVESAIERIEKHNGELNAVIYKAYDQARSAASGKLPDGPFRGVPFFVKDLGQRVLGWPRTSGSRFASPVNDKDDTELVRRFRASGVVIMGKTNTPEYGITGTTESALLGPCRNPWNTNHITGGSSGGSAAAVAAGIVPIGHANDGLGSIRIPASCCGLVGLKPTRDRNPNGPYDYEYASNWIADHIVSRTVRDSAAMLDATGYPQPASPYGPPLKNMPYMDEITKSPGKLRIIWSSETPKGKPIDPEVQNALERTAETLKSLGHDVAARGLPIDYDTLYKARNVVGPSNFAAAMARRIEEAGRQPKPDELEPLTWALLETGRRVTGEQAFWGLQTLRIMTRQILERFEEFDVYLCPVMGTPPPEIGYIDPVKVDPREVNKRQAIVFPFTPPFNFTGQPSISLPLWQSEKGLPIGLMFTARYGDEATLFRLAAQLEKELPWKDRRPPIWDI
ncbi:MAG TPA: amidase family protein [Blastocatellia bacterium]|nr:amidase family protein [Blastocatellia bacterium]